MTKKRKRPQAQKVRNEPLMRAMQEKRYGNAAGTHRSKKAYTRKNKHGKAWE